MHLHVITSYMYGTTGVIVTLDCGHTVFLQTVPATSGLTSSLMGFMSIMV